MDPPELCFLDTLRYFEFRKIQRTYGGAILSPNRHPILSVLVFILWAITFAVSSIKYKDGTLSFKFNDWDQNTITSKALLSVGVGLLVVSLILIIVAIQWNVQFVIEAFFIVLLLAAMASIITQTLTDQGSYTNTLSLSVIAVISATLLGLIIGNSIWLLDFVPAFLGWRYDNISISKNNTTHILSHRGFPYGACIRLALYLILILPLWLPILGILFINAMLQVLGAPLDVLFPWNVLFKLNREYFILNIEHYEQYENVKGPYHENKNKIENYTQHSRKYSNNYRNYNNNSNNNLLHSSDYSITDINNNANDDHCYDYDYMHPHEHDLDDDNNENNNSDDDDFGLCYDYSRNNNNNNNSKQMKMRGDNNSSISDYGSFNEHPNYNYYNIINRSRSTSPSLSSSSLSSSIHRRAIPSVPMGIDIPARNLAQQEPEDNQVFRTPVSSASVISRENSGSQGSKIDTPSNGISPFAQNNDNNNNNNNQNNDSSSIYQHTQVPLPWSAQPVPSPVPLPVPGCNNESNSSNDCSSNRHRTVLATVSYHPADGPCSLCRLLDWCCLCSNSDNSSNVNVNDDSNRDRRRQQQTTTTTTTTTTSTVIGGPGTTVMVKGNMNIGSDVHSEGDDASTHSLPHYLPHSSLQQEQSTSPLQGTPLEPEPESQSQQLSSARHAYQVPSRSCEMCRHPLLRFQYQGQVNGLGLPHGNGIWRDSDPHGEWLTGIFQDGLPYSPHSSREYMNGGTFVSVRIGAAVCSDGNIDTVSLRSSWLDRPKYILSAAESCVSGSFYKNFPSVTYLLGKPPSDGVPVTEVVKRLQNLNAGGDTNDNDSGSSSGSSGSVDDDFISNNATIPYKKLQQLQLQSQPTQKTHRRSRSFAYASRRSYGDESKDSGDDGSYISNNLKPKNNYNYNENYNHNYNFYPLIHGGRDSYRHTVHPPRRSYSHGDISLLTNNLNFSIDLNKPIRPDVDTKRSLDAAASTDMQTPSISLTSLRDITTSQMDTPISDSDCDSPLSGDINETNKKKSKSNKGGVQRQRQYQQQYVQSLIPPSSSHPSSSKSRYYSRYDGQNQSQRQKKTVEVFVFIPGFNSNLNFCIGIFSQFLTLGCYPTHLLPFIFQWPAQHIVTYNLALKEAHSEELIRNLDQFLLDLQEIGMTRVNFLAHSMGARVLVHYLTHTTFWGKRHQQKQQQQHVSNQQDITTTNTDANVAAAAADACERGRSRDGPTSFIHAHDNNNINNNNNNEDDDDTSGVILGNVILSNPEADLDTFISQAILLESIAERITVYADKDDTALFWAEKMNRFFLGGEATPTPPTTTSTSTAMPPPLSETRLSTSTSAPASASSRWLSFPHLQMSLSRPSLGRVDHALRHPATTTTSNATARNRNTGRLLDIDIINATYLQSNVHSIRHSYFNLSREVIEDIRELVVTRRTAAERDGRLVRRSDSNIYDFLIAPSFLKN